ncbi:carboxypeptidase regulatory-like domain-containing protein [Streptomyces sp. NPDC050416]|uniref:carboxypeptidase regulatory-like domain-containing protein n=1 Tax=Streptomyces sp. NPDC050416 TaxID=3365611 RepID=UPI0037A98AF8
MPRPVGGGPDGELWGAATIAPGREGILDVASAQGAAPGATLSLTAPRGTRVTATPLDAPGTLGRVAADGRTATYTVSGEAAGQPWQGRTFPFVLPVSADAVPGTRLRDCVLRITDAAGVRRAAGRCAVTVGLAGPTLTLPLSGVTLDVRPRIAGTAHPGARVTVRDKDDREACATTAAPHGTWACTPGARSRRAPTGSRRSPR